MKKEKRSKKLVLTGITSSGKPHLGNYISVIKPAIDLSKKKDFEVNIFIADYHSLTKVWDKEKRKQYINEVTATLLALDLDINKVTFYKQSDIPEIMEVNWIITSMTSKGLLNRSHAYKEVLKNKDLAVSKMNMGLFNYPILMAADIISFNAEQVLVGKDQLQHLEITRNIIRRFKHIYKDEILNIPEALINPNCTIIPGLDGKKMSKSYGNTIPIFSSNKSLKNLIMKIVTGSKNNEKEGIENCTIFKLYKSFSSNLEEYESFFKTYKDGKNWKEAKQDLFEKIEKSLKVSFDKYTYFIENTKVMEKFLKEGACKARNKSKKILTNMKQQIGIL